MIFYDKPARLAPGVENLIVGTVHELVPSDFVEIRNPKPEARRKSE
jgi:hypothetical protein